MKNVLFWIAASLAAMVWLFILFRVVHALDHALTNRVERNKK